jgi:large subunit ribosomal protein L24
MQPRFKIKKNDSVLVQVGKDRGKTGKVLAMFPRDGRVLVEGLNIVRKHIRPRRSGEKGQRVEVPSPMPIARVMLMCPSCGKATRVGIRRTAGETGTTRERVCKKCSAVIP